jgi:hypothetical protein
MHPGKGKGGAMAATDVKELVVTGPARDRLYELFTRVYAGRHDVRVVLDRRRAPWAQGERARRADERRREPPAWVFPPIE